MNADSCISYELDADNRIGRVGGPWDEFAARNEAPHLTAANVLGRSLWEFIGPEEVLALYRILFERVRAMQAAASFPYRCDAPQERRYMQLTIIPSPSGRLTLESLTLRTERREAVRLLEQVERDPERLLKVCSWCNRVELESGHWCAAEEAVRKLELFTEPVLPTLTHGICQECLDATRSGP